MREKITQSLMVLLLVILISIPIVLGVPTSVGKVGREGQPNNSTEDAIKDKIVFIDAGHGGKDPGTNIGDLFEKDITLDISMKLKKMLEERGIKTIMIREDDSFRSFLSRTAVVNRFILEKELEKQKSRRNSYGKLVEANSDVYGPNYLIEENPFIDALYDINNKINLVNEYVINAEKSERTGIFTKSASVNASGITASDDMKEILDITRENYEMDMIFISIHINNLGTKSNDQNLASGVQVYYRDNGAPQYKENLNYYKNYNIELRKGLASSILEQLNLTTDFSQKWSELYREDYGVLRETNLASVLIEAGFINNPNDRDMLKMDETRENIAEGILKGIMRYFEEINNPINLD